MAPGCDGGTNSGLRFNTRSNYGHGGCVYDRALSPMMEYAPDTLTVVTLIGASTAIFAASVGLCQNDIKRVIAYSRVRNLGICFLRAVFRLIRLGFTIF